VIGKLIVSIAGLWSLLTLAPALAQNTSAPPRNVDDIFALLDRYTVDPAVAQKGLLSRAARVPPTTSDKTELANFYLNRALAKSALGHSEQYLADLRLALENAPSRSQLYYLTFLRIAREEGRNGSLLRALQLFEEMARIVPQGYIAIRMVAHDNLSSIRRELGDHASGRVELAKIEQIIKERKSNLDSEHVDRAILEDARAGQYEAEGKLVEAERARRTVTKEYDLHIPVNRQRLAEGRFAGTEGQVQVTRETYLLNLVANLGMQGKLVEAEGALRDVLGQIVKRSKRYHPHTGLALRRFAEIVLQQGRYREAERLAAEAIDIFQKSGTEELSRNLIAVRKTLGAALVGQQLWQRAIAEFEGIADSIRKDPFLAARYPLGHIDWGLALVKAGQAQTAVTMLETLAKSTSSRLSDAADETAQTRGMLAMALAASGDHDRALNEFRRALPVLLAYAGGDGDAENGGVVRAARLRYILEAYIDLLTGQQQVPGAEAIAESFRVADAARGSSVQRALFESAARASISDAGLAAIVREEQDARVRLGVLTRLLGRLLGAPPEEQLPKVIAGIRAEIENLRAQRIKFKSDIERRFPDYANLVDPKPVTLRQARAALKPGEARISAYVGQDKTYVWAIPQQGAPAFAAVAVSDKALMNSVTQMRKALDIGNPVMTDFPRFDTAASHKLYNELLKPVEAGWKDATSLIIVPHRALGLLPFSLLVTAPGEVAADATARFDGYRGVQWLLRKVAVTQLPSVNALTTLRALPAAAANRREFIGFGDPYFSKTQQAEAATQGNVQVAVLGASLRNLRIDTVALPTAPEDTSDTTLRNAPAVANSSTLAQLARLPETADEIRDIARALKADMNKDVFLGVEANEKNVKSINLTDRKVIAFATHGLSPGDLNGLEQPALALSAPDVAGIDGDGLLTMEEILALKLNADWVVLSACNTGSGDGAGGEAVSGLGRAFFYAGARSLLVSNWPVETGSAKLLTTEVFKRSAENPALTRAQALRQTMLWLMDSAGQRDAAGKIEFTYAHPMFWAPFALIGDGGR
jgi:CHAT domain-containing protein/tetratricopeptide (TPR) repeat protein